ncbi:Cytochrome P450 1B1 [Manis pentadactyla]|nr:Cytochrome P450 1B1 [Manis pentadactyla]
MLLLFSLLATSHQPLSTCHTEFTIDDEITQIILRHCKSQIPGAEKAKRDAASKAISHLGGARSLALVSKGDGNAALEIPGSGGPTYFYEGAGQQRIKDIDFQDPLTWFESCSGTPALQNNKGNVAAASDSHPGVAFSVIWSSPHPAASCVITWCPSNLHFGNCCVTEVCCHDIEITSHGVTVLAFQEPVMDWSIRDS